MCHYLLHFAVIKGNSTTNIRLVFNTNFHLPDFPSLKDYYLSTGLNLIEMILSIPNRFCKNYIGIFSDTEKAFLQISIEKKERDFFVICRRKSERRGVYWHQRVVFGIMYSPYLLVVILQYHFNMAQEN